jgi:hypothetical protein
MLEEALQRNHLSSSPEAQGIWNRVELILHSPLGENQLVRLINLLKFAMIAGDDVSRSISTSIYLATGNIPEHLIVSDDSAEVLSRLIGWRRIFGCFTQNARHSSLPPKAIHWLKDELNTILLQVRNRSLSIDLLPPLPTIKVESHADAEPQK